MGKSTPSAPTPPDPKETAAAQAGYNADTARLNAQLNRVNEVTPYGNLTYSQDRAGPDFNTYLAGRQNEYTGSLPSREVQDASEGQRYSIAGAAESPEEFRSRIQADYNKQYPGGDTWTATTTLSPEQQNLLNLSTAAQQTYGEAALSQLQRAKEGLSTPFTPNFATLDDPNVSRDQVEKALTERMAPLQERDRAALETRLANQGIGMGSTMWNRAQDDFNRGLNDARLGVIAAGGQEQSRQASLNQALRQASLQEQLTLRSQPINEATALLTGQQVQQPTFTAVPQTSVAPVDYTGAVNSSYAAQQQAYQQALQRQQSMMGGITGLIGTAAGAAFGSPWLGGMFGSALGGLKG